MILGCKIRDSYCQNHHVYKEIVTVDPEMTEKEDYLHQSSK